MQKLIGVMLLLGISLSAGQSAADKLHRRAAYLRLLRQWLTEITGQLRISLPLTADLLRMTAENPVYRSLEFLQTAAVNAGQFPDCWENALRSDRMLTAEMHDVLSAVGQTLGSTALDGQLSVLTLCTERLADLQRQAEQTAREKSSLYRSMGLFGGLFAVILLL